MRRILWIWALLMLACGEEVQAPSQVPAAPDIAQSAEPPTEVLHSGQQLYEQYCGSCHGENAHGRGPVANALDPPPADLTRLRAKFGKPLDGRLVDFIDGRKMPRAHGTSDMPVWGERLFTDMKPGVGQEMARRGIIWAIVGYLETLQREQP